MKTCFSLIAVAVGSRFGGRTIREKNKNNISERSRNLWPDTRMLSLKKKKTNRKLREKSSSWTDLSQAADGVTGSISTARHQQRFTYVIVLYRFEDQQENKKNKKSTLIVGFMQHLSVELKHNHSRKFFQFNWRIIDWLGLYTHTHTQQILLQLIQLFLKRASRVL